MDKITLGRYEEAATDFIDHYSQIKPGRIYELMGTFFKDRGRTLDIGCASGRDLAYMKGAGYEVEGLDAVASFVEHCQRILEDVTVHYDSLPALATLKGEGLYDNVLLSSVLMHIPAEEQAESVANLLRIVKKGGRLVLSLRHQRVNEAEDKDRERDGRLYYNISAERLVTLFETQGGRLLFKEEQPEMVRKDVTWHNFVFEKRAEDVRADIGNVTSEVREVLNAAFEVSKKYGFEDSLKNEIETYLKNR